MNKTFVLQHQVRQWLFIIQIGCHAKSRIQYVYFSVEVIVVCEHSRINNKTSIGSVYDGMCRLLLGDTELEIIS